MNQNSTTKTFSRYGRPAWRGLGASVTIVIALVLMTGAAFAQPDGSPFAMPSTASQGVDAARQADSDRWAAQGEYYTAIWEAGSSANSARYSAMAASLGVGTGEAILAAANPSMNVALWYAPGAFASSSDSYFAQNPELSFASRWAAGNATLASDASANPELTLVRNWEAARAAEAAGELVCTPEDFAC